MTNELLLNNIHLIHMAVEHYLQENRPVLDTGFWNEDWVEMRRFQSELEKQEITGDSP